MPRPLKTLLLTLLVIIVAWLPRVLALDAFVTPDEPRWLTRSANFYQGLTSQNWAQTYQREHPGVTVMWAGTLAWLTHFPDYPQYTPGPFHPDETTLEAWLKNNTDLTALQMLVAARWWMVTWISLLLGLSFWLLQRLTNPIFAFIAALWVAFEPFYVALSRLLHLDALLASLLLTSLLALLVFLEKGRQRRWLLLSGVLLGLGGLTKVPALALALFGTGLLLWYGWQQRNIVNWSQSLIAIMIWGGTAVVTVIVLFPALWVAPVETLTNMVTVVSYYAEEGHGDGVYFLGQISPSPGWLFYPVVWLFRASPFTFVGSIVAVLALWQSRKTDSLTTEYRIVTILLAFGLFFALFISLSAKQQERYLVPIFPFLGIVTMWGFWGFYRQFPRYRREVFLGGLLLTQIASAIGGYPYYFTYYNPMVVGTITAPSVLTIGSGEGLREAAEWTEGYSDDPNKHVLSWYDNGPLSYYLGDIEARPLSENWSPTAWCGVSYIISYVNQWQRHLPNEQEYQYLINLERPYLIKLNGIEYVRIYNMEGQSLPDFPESNDNAKADFGGLIRLTTVDIDRTEVQAGDSFRVTLNLQNLAPIPADYNVLVKLIAPDGSEVWREEGYPWGAPTSDWDLCEVRPDGHEVVVPATAVPGDYILMMEFYDPSTFAPLEITEANRTIPLGESSHPVATIHIVP